MSRWHLSANKEACRNAARQCESAGLLCSGEVAENHCHGAAYFKRAVRAENAARFGDGWVWCAGTFLYGNALGDLAGVYRDFVAGGISRVRENILGHYALAVKHRSKLSLFTDPNGAFSLYYREGADWFVSNSLSLCGASSADRVVDVTRGLITVLQTNAPGEDTLFAGVKRLFGSQEIRVDLSNGSLEVRPIPEMQEDAWDIPMAEAMERYVGRVRKVFGRITAVKPLALLGTGGLDSRTILAAVLDQKASPTLMCAKGTSTDYDPHDMAIIRTIAKRFGLPFTPLDWSGSEVHSRETLEGLFEAYGFQYEIYGCPEGFVRCFDGGVAPYPQLFLGGYGAAFTNSKPWELQNPSFSFDDLVDDSMKSFGVDRMSLIRDKAGYRTELARGIRSALVHGGIVYPEQGAPLASFVEAKLFLYIRAEARFLNLINEFGHYLAPFLMKGLHDPLVRMPAALRRNDEFQLRLIATLSPELVDMPLFSGGRPAQIDRDTFRMTRSPQTKTYTLGERLQNRWRRVVSEVKPDMRAVYSRSLTEDKLAQKWFSDPGELGPKVLARALHYTVGIDSLKSGR